MSARFSATILALPEVKRRPAFYSAWESSLTSSISALRCRHGALAPSVHCDRRLPYLDEADAATLRLWMRLAEADEGWNCSPIATDQSAAQVTANSGPPANTARQETATAERTCSSRGRPPPMAAAPFELQQGRRRLDAFVSLPRRAPLRIGRLDDYTKNKRISYEI